MELKFLGRETGLAENHTSAYFVTDKNELVVIDCSVSAFQKLKQLRLQDYKHIYVHITHTHGDHVSGLSLLVQYMYFKHQTTITIVSPSYEVEDDLRTLLRIEGCSRDWYALTTAGVFKKEWLKNTVLTHHTPQLEGKCFGYVFNIDGKTIVYTGDTNTLAPFELFIEHCDELYVDVCISKSPAHLHIDNAINRIVCLAECDVKVYLMHLDDVYKAEKLVAYIPNIDVVTCVD